jgi:uncharacterized membrane protein
MVRRHKLHHFVDKKKVREAILAAEASTDAPIFVSIAPYFWGNVRRTAESVLRKHARKRSPKRNAVLFFVVPSRREFAVVGEAGVHEALGQRGWESAIEDMQVHFRDGDATTALVHGIQTIGRELARHFPRAPEDQ